MKNNIRKLVVIGTEYAAAPEELIKFSHNEVAELTNAAANMDSESLLHLYGGLIKIMRFRAMNGDGMSSEQARQFLHVGIDEVCSSLELFEQPTIVAGGKA